MAIVIEADGESREVEPRDGKYFQLEELYEYCKCHNVQVIALADNQRFMWLDEEGKFASHQTINAIATDLLHAAGGMLDDYVVGSVLICLKSQVE